MIAVDIDPKKIELAKNNAAIYGVSEKIKFIVGDIIKLAPMLKADAVFLSPPWGGPSYLKERVYDLEKTLKPVPFSTLINACMNISPNIAVYLPKNVDTYDVSINFFLMNHTAKLEQLLYTHAEMQLIHSTLYC